MPARWRRGLESVLRKLAAWSIAILGSLGVFALYTRPDFLVVLADQAWSCF